MTNTDAATEVPWRDVAGAVLDQRQRIGSIEPLFYLQFVSPKDGRIDTIPVTRGPSTQTPLAWHIDIGTDTYQVSPSIHSPGNYHSPNPVVFRQVGRLTLEMTDTPPTTTEATEAAEAAPEVLTGAEKAVGDLLGQLRLNPGPNELSTVLGWLDSHDVLDAVNASGNKPPPEPPPVTAETVTTPATDAAAGEATSNASETAPPAVAPTTAPVEPTASHAAAEAATEATTGAEVPAGDAGAPVESAPAESSVPPEATPPAEVVTTPPEPTAKELVSLAVGALQKLAEKL